MRTVLTGLVFSMAVSPAFARIPIGVCAADGSIPHVRFLCENYGRDEVGKQWCQVTKGCQWIPLQGRSLCRAHESVPHMQPFCENQGGAENGKQACETTPGCEWAEH